MVRIHGIMSIITEGLFDKLWIGIGSYLSMGQTTTTLINSSSSVSSSVPTALTPGAPAGTYALNGLENVNLYNGSLSAQLPLLTIGGRGKVSFTIALTIARPSWVINTQIVKTCVFPDSQTSCNFQWSSTPYANWYRPVVGDQQYGPGMVYIRRSAVQGRACSIAANGVYDDVSYGVTFSYLVFVQPDGTEHALYDTDRQGPWTWSGNGSTCSTPATYGNGQIPQYGLRPGNYTAMDGSGISFVFDSVGNPPVPTGIQDKNLESQLVGIGPVELVYFGNLKFPDGSI